MSSSSGISKISKGGVHPLHPVVIESAKQRQAKKGGAGTAKVSFNGSTGGGGIIGGLNKNKKRS